MAFQNLNNQPRGSKSLLLFFFGAFFAASIVLNIFLFIKYVELQKELKYSKIALEAKQKSAQINNFTRFLVEEVLNAKGSVDFETRLQLENAIRDLEDEEILTQWKTFTESKTESQMQTEVTKLLSILTKKASM